VYAVIDIETTGGHYHKDRIIEIAVVIFDGEKIIEEFTTLINPLKPIGPFIQTLTGISNSMVEGAPTFIEVADTILRLTEGNVFVAHNARFDYGFVKAEFRRMGIPFQRQQVCTVNMSRSILPGFRSYSLGNLCRDLEIKVDHRHRAFGDAAATARLLGILLDQDKNGMILQVIQEHFAPSRIPVHIPVDMINTLPEEPGIFYFTDEKGKSLFIARGKNIREKVLQLLGSDNTVLIPELLKEQTRDISFELTGNDLVASLLESAEIQRLHPSFNGVPRYRKNSYGLFVSLDENGYTHLAIDTLNEEERRPMLKFSSKIRAERVLSKIYSLTDISPAFKKIHPPKLYNQKVEKTLSKYLYPYPNFLIVDMGRSGEERSVIWIKDEEVNGYGYFDPQHTGNHIHSILDVIKPLQETSEMRKLIIEYVRKNNKVIDIYPLDN